MSAATEQATIAGAEVLRLWSVTTILKMALGSSEGLVYWNCEQTAIAAVDKRQTLDMRVNSDGRDATIKWLIQERWNATERARVRGTNVHKWAEAVALGIEPPELEPQEVAYGEQLAKWMRKWKPQYVMAEAPVYNVERRYAGTCDGLMVVDGRTLIFDYKTTEKGPDAKSRPPYPEAALQLCAYAHAESVGVLAEQRYDDRRQRYYLFDSTIEHPPMPKIDGAISIVISPVDCYAVPVSIGPVVWQSWLHALALAQWNESGWRPAFGPMLDNREAAE